MDVKKHPFLNEIDADLIEPQRLAGSVIDHCIVKRKRGETGRMMSPYEALKALVFEAEVVMVGAENLAFGMKLSDEDRQRLRVAVGRISTIAREATDGH